MALNKTIILSDSICDLGDEILNKYSIDLNPLTVSKGEDSFLDGKEITPDDIYEYYDKTGELCKTSAVNVQSSIDFLAAHQKPDTDIVYFLMSSDMSSTYQNAVTAAAEFNNVYVVDTKNISTGSGLLVLHAAEMAENGKSGKEICDECTKLSQYVDASFVVDTLEYLKKGGRCSTIAALGANILKLRPCIEVTDGKMAVNKKYRGKMSDVLVSYCKDRLSDLNDIVPDHIFITHSGCDEETIKKVEDTVKETEYFKNIHITRAGCTVSTHCGPGTLGVLYIRKTPVK